MAGRHGLPSAGAAAPATSILTALDGPAAFVADPLAQWRATAVGTRTAQSEGTILRLANAGTVSLSGEVQAHVYGWLGGDVVRAPFSVDLTQRGSPRPVSAPRKGELLYARPMNFKVGEAVVLGDGKLTPGGMIAIVDSVSTAAGRTLISYHKGSLLDAFSELDLVSQIPLEKKAKAKKAALAARSNPADIGGGVTFGEDFNPSKSFTFGKDPSISGTVGLDFHPSVTISITVNTAAFLPTGMSVHFALDASTKIYATLTATGGVSGSQSFPLARIAFGAVEIGPITVVPELSSSLDAKYSASATATLSRSISETAHLGETVSASPGHFSKTGDSNNGFARPVIDSSSSPTFSAKAEASGQISLEFDLAVEGIAGPDAEAAAGIDFTVDPSASPWWKVVGTGDFSIGFDLNSLGIPLLSKLLGLLHIDTDPSWSLGSYSYTLASANGPLGGTSSGGGPVGGGSGGSGGSGGGVPVVGGSSIGPVPAGSYAETDGGVSHTWTDYSDGGGSEGPSIATNQTVGVSCKVTGLAVTDGNTAWYQISSSPWNGDYYVSADAFYNNGQTSGSLHGTPYVDPAVPDCRGQSGGGGGGGGAGGLSGTPETTGGQANTWTNSSNAGGTAGPVIGSNQTVLIACRLSGFTVGDGNSWWYQVASSPWSDDFYVSADAFYNNGATTGSLHGTPFVDPNVPACGSSGGGGGGGGGGTGTTYTETTGGVTHTWTDYSDAGGSQGPSISSGQSVQITCRIDGFAVADGNTAWYQIASSPWSNAYYASADAFYNNGSTSGSLHGTPYYDPAVPVCGSSGGGGSPPPPPPPPPPTYGETTGGVTHTWTNYSNAGGTEGPSISTNDTVQIACRLTGFQVADGNTWWYRIASSPWSDNYYASADAFYNNGQTSGPLKGTPFVDTNVPTC